MPFPIDVSRPFRYPSELQRLAEAVRHAGDYDETRWIEWKSKLDLASDPGRLHLVKQILGFANRDPEVAANWAEGHAYLVVGVDPRRLDGVTPVDPQALSQSLMPYVGAEIVWTPEYISLDGHQVLIVIVGPPRPGDLIHFLRRDLIDRKTQKVHHQQGTIFIRRNGETVVAEEEERRMLQRRARASSNRLAVSVTPSNASIEAAPDLQPLLARWAAQERERLLKPLQEDQASSPSKRASTSGFRIAPTSDPRTPAEYTAEVEDYLAQAQETYQARAAAEFTDHPPAALHLNITNQTDRPFLAVQVTATIENSAAQIPDPENKFGKPPELPMPPRPYGPVMSVPGLEAVQASLANVTSSLALFRAATRRHEMTTLRLSAVGPRYRPRWVISQVIEGLRIVFDPVTVRPGGTIELDPVPLAVKASPGAILTVHWTATSTSSDGVLAGTTGITVDSSTVPTFTALSSEVD